MQRPSSPVIACRWYMPWVWLGLALVAYPWAFVVLEGLHDCLPFTGRLVLFFLPPTLSGVGGLGEMWRMKKVSWPAMAAVALSIFWFVIAFTTYPSPIPKPYYLWRW